MACFKLASGAGLRQEGTLQPPEKSTAQDIWFISLFSHHLLNVCCDVHLGDHADYRGSPIPRELPVRWGKQWAARYSVGCGVLGRAAKAGLSTVPPLSRRAGSVPEESLGWKRLGGRGC